MSILAMPAPPPPHAQRPVAWQEFRPPVATYPQRNASEKIALPSIRQAFPELQLSVQPHGGSSGPPSLATSPSAVQAEAVPSEYVHSPAHNKRRRLSMGDDREGERASQVPRFYASTSSTTPQVRSPPRGPAPTPEAWRGSDRAASFQADRGFPSAQTPVPLEVRDRAEPRLTLPNLPAFSFERGASQTPRYGGRPGEEYAQEIMKPSVSHGNIPGMDAGPPAAYRPQNYHYTGAQHPTRVQSMSVGGHASFDRTPFSSGSYGPSYQDGLMRMGDLGMGMNGDHKQRKRRGNLPKETTDKLRAWFVAHLHHPYPTEDEKQDLMRQTGLQMNQISNWFINARRRQLPTMINNARAESEAMTSQGVEGAKLMTAAERASNYGGHDSKRSSVALSDGESGDFDDLELDTMKRQRASSLKRGSV